MTTLSKPLRNELARTVLAARTLAEEAAAKALHTLGVDEADAPGHLDHDGRLLRRKLRAQARQLGDKEDAGKKGCYEIGHIAEKIAYDHWHRLLFARFLAENDLLISPDHGIGVSLSDCEELAPDLGYRDGWEVAASFAARMLPQIFRADDPAGNVVFAPEDRVALRKLVTDLPADIFLADDALGWVYQFWQAQRKEDVNKSGNKIGADEIAPVTQLFTEDYMVLFLLHNTLGAWWAGKTLTTEIARSAKTEEECRRAVALPGVDWEYLRWRREELTTKNTKEHKENTDGSISVISALSVVDDPQASEAKELTAKNAKEHKENADGSLSVISALSVVNDPQASEAKELTTKNTKEHKENADGSLSVISELSVVNPPYIPAAGTFDGWPKTARELRLLDPSMGSGHFLVFELPILVAMRMAEEGLSKEEAVDAVIRDNLFGLEIDPRCTQIAAFNLALAAWKLLGAYRQLPPMNLACCGLGINARKEDWLKLANGDTRLRGGMEQLFDLFQKAPELGSLINPRRIAGDLITADFHELLPLLEQALSREETQRDDTLAEMGVTARGLAQAAEILGGQFTLVATNVPYLGRGKQDDALKDYCAKHHPDAKADLATCFVDRSYELCAKGGTVALVTPQNWLFLGTYKNLRQRLLKDAAWDAVARLGPRAFETIGGEVVNVALLAISATRSSPDHAFVGLDVADQRMPEEKNSALRAEPVRLVGQKGQLENPDARVVLALRSQIELLEKYANAYVGLHVGGWDTFRRGIWELPQITKDWRTVQGSVVNGILCSGLNDIAFWQDDGLCHETNPNARVQGRRAWGKMGVITSPMNDLPFSLYYGGLFDNNTCVIVPNKSSNLAALWCFCSSPEYSVAVRQIDQALKVTNATLVKVPFDLAHWQKVAEEKYPDGLPKPHSDDPTQWLFNGHPKDSTTPLQVAVARLLGYRWPRQTGSEFPDCPALGPDGLEPLADTDGIVCISAIKGEQPAAERLRALLAAAFGMDWNAVKQAELLEQSGFGGKTLDEWLRNGFFEQHCQLFHQRPFIWQIWDGLRDGFSVLVNYHKLTRAALEKLTYTYLGDWIARQKASVAAGEEGSDAKLAAAQKLKDKLEKILEGESPYDIFVRWKPLTKQPIGWEPDLNDGVRLNIRPFVEAGILRKTPKIHWRKDRGNDVPSAPWYKHFNGDRINDHHLTLAEKRDGRD